MKKSLLCLFVIGFILGLFLMPVSASSVEPSFTIDLQYSVNDRAFSDQTVRIYRIAAFDSAGNYAAAAPFDGYHVKIHGITTQKEWRDAANTLAFYAAADQLEPNYTAKTDSHGCAFFRNVEPGLYLIEGFTVKEIEGTYRFENFILFVPTPQSNGTMKYDVEAKPKADFTPEPNEPVKPDEPDKPNKPDVPDKPDETDIPKAPAKVQYQVTKLWRDAGTDAQRPQSVTVVIHKNGEMHESVQLHAGNNWTYTWSAPENDDTWLVIEEDIPDGYTVVITSFGRSFFVTNSRTVELENAPQTGETLSLLPFVITMSLSGFVLNAMGIWRKRKHG